MDTLLVFSFSSASFIRISLFNWQKETLENEVHSNMLNIISFMAINFIGDFAENLSV
jgi:hypothetical protein